jgi:signal transduction histidine kinase
MLTWIRKLVAAPVFEDKEKTRAAGLLNAILLILLTITMLIIPSFIVVDPASAMFDLPIGAVMVAVSLGLLFLTRRGYVRIAGWLLSSALLVVITVTTYIFGGVRSNSATAYFLVITIAALLLSGRAAVIFGVLSILAALGVFYAEIRGAIVIPMPASVELVDWFLLSMTLGMGSLLLRFAVRSIAEGFEQARQEITERKRAEKEAQRRAAQATLIYEVGQHVSSKLELEALLSEVVTAVRDAFDYYGVMILLVGEEGKRLAMQSIAGGYADIFPRDLWLAIGEGMIGYAAAGGETQISGDVSKDPHYVCKADEETKSELAVPIKSGEKVIGVLDIQSDEFDAFDETDVMLMETLADQVAVAIENARLYATAQQELAERKRAEEQLQQYAVELEQANEEVKQFAYIVSHDLRAPLVNLKGFSAELRFALDEIQSAMSTALLHLDEDQQQTLTFALEEDVPEALGFIDSSVTRMDRFISALLKLSRLGRRELHLEPVDMEALVQAALQSLRHQIEERQVRVTVGPLPEVIADRTSMEQIMGNILTNAVKYLAPDRPGEVEITAECDDDETTFRIRDNGQGIAEDDVPKVFMPFRRVGRQDVPGEGMGLPYVQALVRRHGGRIWCESELGTGTTFSFTISNHLAGGGNHA